MGTPHDGDSGPFDELPELPPDVRIPDDASALAAEAAEVRRQLREERVGGSRSGARVLPGDGFRGSVPPEGGPAATEPASLRIPLLIMTAALLAAVISLFAAAWPSQRRGVAPAASAGTSGAVATSAARPTLPAVDLVDDEGTTVPLATLLPAVLILADDCPCAAEIAATVPPGVTVVAVGTARGSAPPPSTATLPGPAPATVRRLRDPGGGLTELVTDGESPGPATPVALVARSGELTRVVDSGTPISAYAADLAFLPTR